MEVKDNLRHTADGSRSSRQTRQTPGDDSAPPRRRNEKRRSSVAVAIEQEQNGNVSHRIPFDVLALVLSHFATLSPTCALHALLVSKATVPLVEQGAYECVSLFSVGAMESFRQLLQRRPALGRRVKALWIAPGRSDSDLISALAPPTSNAALEARQRKVQSLAREILRGCRNLRHLALDGGFLTPQCVEGFGTACKPISLLCVNPHSFLGHFSAPIFRTTVRRLEVVDTTLAVEEVDEIRQMHALRHFVWTAPRANSDVTRDVSVLLRILSPKARDPTSDEEERRLMSILTSSGNAPPERARKNADLQSICTATSQARAAALAASFKKVVESVELVHDEDRLDSDGRDADDAEEDVHFRSAMRAIKAGYYVDSSRANSSSLHKPTGVELQTQALSSLMHALQLRTSNTKQTVEQDLEHDDEDDDDDEVVDEWEALRDVVCQRRTANSTSSSRLFAGVGIGGSGGGGATVVNSGTSSHLMRSGRSSGMSTPGWATISRSASPTRTQTATANSNVNSGSTTPARYDEIDGGKALQRVWQRWRQQVGRGDLDEL